MVREVSPPSQRYGLQTVSQIPIATSSRHPYKTTARPASKRPILGERSDNIAIKPRSLKPKARTSPKKPVTIVTHISNISSPASSVSTAYASPRKRPSLSLETRVFRYDADELLLDMEPPESLAGMSSPGSVIMDLPERFRAVRGDGRMLTPADSQESIAERRRSKTPTAAQTISKQLNRLPTPPPSQSNEDVALPPSKTSRTHPRPAPTPPRQVSREHLASPTQDPSPNPRQKKTARVSILSPSRPTAVSTPRPLLTSLSRLTGGPSTPSYATQSSLAIRDRIIPSTAPPPRRARASTVGPTKKPAIKPRKSMPETTKQTKPARVRHSLTPDAIMALTGRPIGFLRVKIEAEPGDDPLLLKGPDEEDYLRQRELSRSQSRTPIPSGKGKEMERASSSQPRQAAGPSRLREVSNYGSPASTSSRRSADQTSTPVRKTPTRGVSESRHEEEVIVTEDSEFQSQDMPYDASPHWGSDEDTDVGEDEVVGVAEMNREKDGQQDSFPDFERELSVGPLPESSPAWTRKSARPAAPSLSTGPQGEKAEETIHASTVPLFVSASSPASSVVDQSCYPVGSPSVHPQIQSLVRDSPATPSPARTQRESSSPVQATTDLQRCVSVTEQTPVKAFAPTFVDCTPIGGVSPSSAAARLLPSRAPTPYARAMFNEEKSAPSSPQSSEEGDVTVEAIAADWEERKDPVAASPEPEQAEQFESAEDVKEDSLDENDQSDMVTQQEELHELPSSPSSAGDRTVGAIAEEWDISVPDIAVMPLEFEYDITTAFTLPTSIDTGSPLLDQQPLFPASPSSSTWDDIEDTEEAEPVVADHSSVVRPVKVIQGGHQLSTVVETVAEDVVFGVSASATSTQESAPSSPSETSFAGDITQEAIPSQWDISVDHASPVFEDHHGGYKIDGPETGSRLAYEFDFRREESLEAESRGFDAEETDISAKMDDVEREEHPEVDAELRSLQEIVIVEREAIAAFNQFISIPPSPLLAEGSSSLSSPVRSGNLEAETKDEKEPEIVESISQHNGQVERSIFNESVAEGREMTGLVTALAPSTPIRSPTMINTALDQGCSPVPPPFNLAQLIASDFDDSADDLVPQLEESIIETVSSSAFAKIETQGDRESVVAPQAARDAEEEQTPVEKEEVAPPVATVPQKLQKETEDVAEEEEQFNTAIPAPGLGLQKVDLTEEEEEFNSRIPGIWAPVNLGVDCGPEMIVSTTEEEDEFNSSLPLERHASVRFQPTDEEGESNTRRLVSIKSVLATQDETAEQITLDSELAVDSRAASDDPAEAAVGTENTPNISATIEGSHHDHTPSNKEPALKSPEEGDITLEAVAENWDVSTEEVERFSTERTSPIVEGYDADLEAEVEQQMEQAGGQDKGDVAMDVMTAPQHETVIVTEGQQPTTQPEVKDGTLEEPSWHLNGEQPIEVAAAALRPADNLLITPVQPVEIVEAAMAQEEEAEEQIEVGDEERKKVSSRIVLRVIDRGIIKVEPEVQHKNSDSAEKVIHDEVEEEVEDVEGLAVGVVVEELQFGAIAEEEMSQASSPQNQEEVEYEEAEELLEHIPSKHDQLVDDKHEYHISEEELDDAEADDSVVQVTAFASAATSTPSTSDSGLVPASQFVDIPITAFAHLSPQFEQATRSEDDTILPASSTSITSTASTLAQQCTPTRQRFANARSGAISSLESMLIRRQSTSSSTTTRPSKLSLVATATDCEWPEQPASVPSDSSSSSREESSSLIAPDNLEGSRGRQSLGEELATATAAEEDEANESFRSVVEVSSLDPRAAARAAAILKLNHAYIEHGVLPSSTSTPASGTIPLPTTPSASSHLKTPRSARRRAYESRHFKTAESARKLGREELLYEAELEIVASKQSRSRSRARSIGGSEAGWESDETELAFPGGWKVTPGKRKRSRSIHSRSRPAIQATPARELETKGKQVSRGNRPWGVGEWKRLEKVFRAEKDAWVNERETKPLPSLFGWARKAFGGSAEAQPKAWENERAVTKFLDQENAHGQSGEWAEKMILLRVKALEKRVNATHREKSEVNDEESRESKKQRVEVKRMGPISTPRRGEEEAGDSTVVSIVPPSTIRRMLGYVWRGGDDTLDSIDLEDVGGSPVKDGDTESRPEMTREREEQVEEVMRPVENKLLTRLKEIRDRPVKTPASSIITATPIQETEMTEGETVEPATPMKQVTPWRATTPAHPSSPAWSPAIPGKWTFSTSTTTATTSISTSTTLHHPATPVPDSTWSGIPSSSSLPSTVTATPKLYPSLNPPMTQRSSALKALFDTPQSSRMAPPRRLANSPSVSDLVKNFEEDGLLGRNLEREGLRRSESRGV